MFNFDIGRSQMTQLYGTYILQNLNQPYKTQELAYFHTGIEIILFEALHAGDIGCPLCSSLIKLFV